MAKVSAVILQSIIFSTTKQFSKNDVYKNVISGTKAVMAKGKILTRLFLKVNKINSLIDMAVDLVV